MNLIVLNMKCFTLSLVLSLLVLATPFPNATSPTIFEINTTSDISGHVVQSLTTSEQKITNKPICDVKQQPGMKCEEKPQQHNRNDTRKRTRRRKKQRRLNGAPPTSSTVGPFVYSSFATDTVQYQEDECPAKWCIKTGWFATTIDVDTADTVQYYYFYRMPTEYLHFKVRAPHDAALALTTKPTESDPMYEVILGGWVNTKSVIRRDRTKPDKIVLSTPYILSKKEYRGFWIRCVGGVVSVGYDGKGEPFMAWKDPKPFPVDYVGIRTGWGAWGMWKLEL